MSNVLSEEKKQQVIALGKLGWSLRRIQEATGVRRETASAYLRTAGVVVCLPGWGRRAPAKPAIQATPDPESKPAIEATPDFIAAFSRKPPVLSTCEAYRERIEEGLVRGRNGKAIWQELVSEHGFTGGYQAVKRFVQKLRGPQRPEAAGIILTAPGEEGQVDYGSRHRHAGPPLTPWPPPQMRTAKLENQIADRTLSTGKAMTTTMSDFENTRLRASECDFF